jgi:hypothetical protein
MPAQGYSQMIMSGDFTTRRRWPVSKMKIRLNTQVLPDDWPPVDFDDIHLDDALAPFRDELIRLRDMMGLMEFLHLFASLTN